MAEDAGDDTYDLVTASFLHSPAEVDRTAALRRASDRVQPCGHLLVISHASAPPWADVQSGHDHHFLTPLEELEALALDPASWQTLIAEVRSRPATAPDGTDTQIDDSVILLRRIGAA